MAMAIGIFLALTEMITEKKTTMENIKIKIVHIKRQGSEEKPSSAVRYQVRERVIKIKITFSISALHENRAPAGN